MRTNNKTPESDKKMNLLMLKKIVAGPNYVNASLNDVINHYVDRWWKITYCSFNVRKHQWVSISVAAVMDWFSRLPAFCPVYVSRGSSALQLQWVSSALSLPTIINSHAPFSSSPCLSSLSSHISPFIHLVPQLLPPSLTLFHLHCTFSALSLNFSLFIHFSFPYLISLFSFPYWFAKHFLSV